MTDKRHAKNFNKFYVALAKAKDIDRTTLDFGKTILKGISGEGMQEAFRKYMKIKSDEDLEGMQRDWYVYIQEELKITSARGLENAAHNNMRRGRKLRAKRMLEEAIAMGTTTALTYHRYGELLEAEGEREEARSNYELAVEHDGLEPTFYISLAESLLKDGKQESFDQAESLLRLAQDIEPGNFYLERNLQDLLRQGRRRLKGKQ